MTSTDYTLHDAAPAAPAAGSQAPASFDTDPADQPKPVKSLWRRMANPFYIFTAGPWIAFTVLVAQGIIASLVTGLTASLIGLLVLPFLAIGFGFYERWRLAKTGHGVIANGHVDYPNASFWEGVLFRLKEIATWREVGSLALTTLWGWIAGAVLFLQIMALGSAGALAYYLGNSNRLYLDWQHLSLYSQGELDYYINQGFSPQPARWLRLLPSTGGSPWQLSPSCSSSLPTSTACWPPPALASPS